MAAVFLTVLFVMSVNVVPQYTIVRLTSHLIILIQEQKQFSPPFESLVRPFPSLPQTFTAQDGVHLNTDE